MATTSARQRHNPDWPEIAGGIIGGLVGAWAMGQVLSAVDQLAPEEPEPRLEEEEPRVMTAAAISEVLLKKALTRRQREPASQTVHYVLGAALGALYATLGAELPALRLGAGTLYGLGVWFAADELALPALHLTPPTKEQPTELRAGMASAHVVFGIVLDSVSRACRKLLAPN